MKKNILVLEDNKEARAMIVKCMEELDEKVVIYQTVSVAEAWSLSMEHNIDVFLIDIVLDTKKHEDISGLIFAEKIREIEKYTFTPLIFTTAFTEHRFCAFANIHSYAYLEKPYKAADIQEITKKALGYVPMKKESKLYFQKKGIRFCIKEDELVYIKAGERKLHIQTTQEEILIPYQTCNQVIEELRERNFIQCSRATIVNRSFIECFDRGNKCIVLREAFGKLEVGSTYRKKMGQEFPVYKKKDD